MSSPELENLVQIGKLQLEAPSRAEIESLIRSGEDRLRDAAKADLSIHSRFDLAYNAAHALALAALRSKGYRSSNRYVVFQALEHTLGWSPSKWRVLAKCHGVRNRTEYEGVDELDEQLVEDLVAVTNELLDAVRIV